ncbi:MAG: hypothetical protein GXO35_05920 [Gammaproteobacteria bacterium]|nr:hypothetical protein [Gammaproteobacteria bacterium]
MILTRLFLTEGIIPARLGKKSLLYMRVLNLKYPQIKVATAGTHMLGRTLIVTMLGVLLMQAGVALWFAPVKELFNPWPPQKLPCAYDITLNKVDWPKNNKLAILVMDYDALVNNDKFSTDAYESYFQKWHAKLESVLPIYILFSSKESALWDLELDFIPVNELKIPCGYIDDPSNPEKYAYMPGLYLYDNGDLKLSYFQFPFFEINDEVASLVFDDIKRFAKGLPVQIVPLHVLAQKKIEPPKDLKLPAFIMLFTGTEWDAPPSESPLRSPRIIRNPDGSVLDYQEFPSGHMGARGRYIIEHITPHLIKAGLNPVGLIPPDKVIQELLNTSEDDFTQKMSSTFPEWTFLQLNPRNTIRYRELTVYPCIIYQNGSTKCLSFYVTKPPSDKYRPLEELLSF